MILWKWGIFIKLWGFKGIESEILFLREWSWFKFYVNFDRKCDHAGIKLDIEIFGFNFYIKYYDSRHWDYEKDRWC